MRSIPYPTRVCAGLASLMLMVTVCQAKWFNPVSWFNANPDKKYETVIVTGNYVQSRVLAELVQHHTDHPVLLLPTGKETDRMFFLGPEGKAIEVKQENYVWLINYIRPKTVLFLGDTSYAPTEYIDRLKSSAATCVYNNSNWEQIAVSVGKLLNVKTLAKEYRQLLGQLDSQGKRRRPGDIDNIWLPDVKPKAAETPQTKPAPAEAAAEKG